MTMQQLFPNLPNIFPIFMMNSLHIYLAQNFPAHILRVSTCNTQTNTIRTPKPIIFPS